MQDSASFWTDIKNLEEQLAKSPDSFCFARLSDVYLKVGLVDDAIHTARQGVTKHPRYLSGLRALSFASHAKGLNDEAMAALKLVTEALPEDIASQKLFGRLLLATGNQDFARRAFRTALEFAPDDMECRIELDSLEKSAGMSEFANEMDEDDETIIEDLEILEELDILEEEPPDSHFQPQTPPPESVVSEALPKHDPLSTGTLAELYVSQGFLTKALAIYRAILADNPADRATAARISELEVLESGPVEPFIDVAENEEAQIEFEPPINIAAEPFFPNPFAEELPRPEFIPENAGQSTAVEINFRDSDAPVLPSSGVADNALSTFDGWL